MREEHDREQQSRDVQHQLLRNEVAVELEQFVWKGGNHYRQQPSLQDQRPDFEKGLAELRKRSGNVPFASLPAERQADIMASLEKDKNPFFFVLRGATITAMFSNPEYGGNFNKTGWKMLGFDDRFSW